MHPPRADTVTQDVLAGLGGPGHLLYEAVKIFNALSPEEQRQRLDRAGVMGNSTVTYKRYTNLYNRNYVPWCRSQGVAPFPITTDKVDEFFAMRAASGTSQATGDGLESMMKPMQHYSTVSGAHGACRRSSLSTIDVVRTPHTRRCTTRRSSWTVLRWMCACAAAA